MRNNHTANNPFRTTAAAEGIYPQLLPKKLRNYILYQAVVEVSAVQAYNLLIPRGHYTEDALIGVIQRMAAKKWQSFYGRNWSNKFPPYRDTSELKGKLK